jgi:uncharacterized membrane protein
MIETPSQSVEDIVADIGTLLRLGVLLAALVLLCGGVIYLYYHAMDTVPDRREFNQNPPSFEGERILNLGLLLLIATPVMRVMYSMFAFARLRDVVYVVLPLVVLIVLMIGFLYTPLVR